MSNLQMKAVLESFLPPGMLDQILPESDLDNLNTGIGANMQSLYEMLFLLAFLRHPPKTPILSDLEKEYGIKTDSSISETLRRQSLNGLVYATPGTASEDNLQSVLTGAGFDVVVYQNMPEIDPATFLSGDYSMTAGNNGGAGDNNYAASFADAATTGAYATTDKDAVLLINESGETWAVPTDQERFRFVFLIAASVTGWRPLNDWRMNEAGTSNWQPSTYATLTKNSVYRVGYGRSLAVTSSADLYKNEDHQDNNVNIPDPSLVATWDMVDNSGTVENRAFVQDIVDGDMETAGVGSWVANQSILSKQASAQSGLQCLRIQDDGVIGLRTCFALQNAVLTQGKTYRISGYARGDGIHTDVVPKVTMGSAIVWTGSYLNDWEYFDLEVYHSDSGTYFGLGPGVIVIPLITGYVEFDHVSVVELTAGVPALDAAADGTGSNTSFYFDESGRGLTFNGTNSIITSLAPAGYSDLFTINAWIRTNTTSKPILNWAAWYLQIDGSGNIEVRDPTTATFTRGAVNDDNLHMVTFVANGAASKIFIDGVVSGLSFTPSGVGVGSGIHIGSDGGAAFFDGEIFSVSIHKEARSNAQVLDMYNIGNSVTYDNQGGLGAYAEQTIPDSEVVLASTAISGTVFSDGTGIPALSYKDATTDKWEIGWLGTASTGAQTISATGTNGIKGVRLMNKYSESSNVYFDNVDITNPVITRAQIPNEQKKDFERLVLKYKPMHTWAAIAVDYI